MIAKMGNQKFLVFVLLLSVILCNQTVLYANGSPNVLRINQTNNSPSILSLNNGTYFEYSIIVNTIHYVNGSFGDFDIENPVVIRNHIEVVDVKSNKVVLSVRYSCNTTGVLDANLSSDIAVEINANYQFFVTNEIMNDISGVFQIFGDNDWEDGTIVTVASRSNSTLEGIKSHNIGELKKTPQGYQEVFFVTASGTSISGEPKSSTYYYDLSTGLLLQIRGSPCDYFLLNLANIDWIWGGISLTNTNLNLGPQQYTDQYQLIANPYSLILSAAAISLATIGMYKLWLDKKARMKRKSNRGVT